MLHRARKYLYCFPWTVMAVLVVFMILSGLMLISAAKGSWMPWAAPQLLRYVVGLCLMVLIAFIDLRFWLDQAYVIYTLCLILLVVVELFGYIGMGAQRWINLGVINLQPSELMKIALILAIARFFHYSEPHEFTKLRTYGVPILLVALPVVLVLKQPDLGTALMLVMVGFCMTFVAGLPWRWLVTGGLSAILAMPLAWQTLRPYQQNRVLTFLDPEKDPLGTGYHIIQSKIALGSGGYLGKGYGHGTQSALNFLPEKQTDFIFAMFGEEFGFIGGVLLLLGYAYLIGYGWYVTGAMRHLFSKFVALGVTSSIFLYVCVNMGMVMGLLPVVGIPLPFISYGGTALLTLLITMGLLIACDIQRHKNTHRTLS